MRIFYAADSSPNPEFQSNLWRKNLYDSLVSLGHEVVEFQYDLAQTFRHLDPSRPEHAQFIQQNRPKLSGELVRQIKGEHARRPLSLFFSYFYDACVEPEALQEIRALGIVTVNWYCNASFQLHLVRQIAPQYDYCLVPEKFRLDDYAALGARPLYCQEAANPEVYHPYDIGFDYDVTFAGQCYADRAEYVTWLRGKGIDVHVWGARWEYHVPPRSRNPIKRWFGKEEGLPAETVGGVLSDVDLVKLYSQSRINLGFSTCGETQASLQKIVQVRLRDFEVPMSGGFYMVEYLEELADFFEFGKEIETYRTREELLDKIRFYLRNAAARERIRMAGWDRCLRDHTWEKRFSTAFQQMGLA